MTSTLDMQTRIQDATINAQAAFFAVISKEFPELKTCEDFSADPTLSFSEASKVATIMFKFNEACLAATTVLVDSISRAAVTLKTFEVTAQGYNGKTDETDDRVFWIRALNHDEVSLVVEGTGATFIGPSSDTDIDLRIGCDSDPDFTLPAQANELRAALLKFTPAKENFIDNREIANDPKLFLETELGYDIDEDSDQPGLWIWTAATDGCDSSFHSAKEALEGAWNHAVTLLLKIKSMSNDEWNALSFDQQKTKLIELFTNF